MPLNVMSISKNYKQISITRLILNPENDRFESVENEKLALETMLNKLGSKIYVLALDIVKRGLSPKPFYVVPYYNKYIVKDGNRRTTAINLLMKKNIHLLELNLKSYIANIFRIQLNQYCVIFIPIILMQTIG